MNNNPHHTMPEAVAYVQRKLDCLIGSALKNGIRVSPSYGCAVHPRTVNGMLRWRCRLANKDMAVIIPGVMCNPIDLILIDRPTFDVSNLHDSARYLMLPGPKEESYRIMNVINETFVGYTSSYYPEWANMILAMRKKYKALGFC